MTEVRLAVDLGSSNTVAVLAGADGRTRPLLFDGAELLPSGVFAESSGTIATGRDAERLARSTPAAFEPHPKRRVDDGVLLLGTRHVDVRDALAAVLARVRDEAGLSAGAPHTVLCHPTGWAAPRREILTDAAARAGLGEVATVSEAIAAGAYFSAVLRRHRVGPVAVVDIGGGTTDIAVVTDEPRPRVIAQAGVDLGGVDIDSALIDFLTRQGPLPDAGDPGYDPVLLWQEVRAAKESLSRTSHTPLRIAGRPVDSHLTRQELEAAAEPILTSIGELAADVIATAGLAPGRLAGVLLVGGGSRIPLAAHVLHTRLGVAPTTVDRPETVVVEGAFLVPQHCLTRTAGPGSGPVRTSTIGPSPASAAGLDPAGLTPAEPSGSAPAGPAGVASPVRPASPTRRRGWLRPALLLGALLCFALPFATVSCGLPDGYGRAGAGGTTTYRGTTLVVGAEPEVTSGHLAPRERWRPDRLAPQPLLIGALLAAFAAFVVAVRRWLRRVGRAAPDPVRRPATLVRLVVVATVALVAGELVTLRLLGERVRSDSAVPADRSAQDFVGVGSGFWLTLVLLTAVIALELRVLRRRHGERQ